MFIQAAHGLAAIHKAGLVHGDVKPDNILLGSNGRVQIADLGRARTLDAVDGGAVTYMAPERLEGAPSSAIADQFGLCTVFLQALYAVRPWSMNRAELVRSTKPERALLRTDVPRSLMRVVRRGLAVTSRDRFENMDALADALTRVLVDARRREDRRAALYTPSPRGSDARCIVVTMLSRGPALGLRRPSTAGPQRTRAVDPRNPRV